MKIWSNGTISDEKKSIDSFNYSLHYGGPAIWEGLRAYEQADGSTKIWGLKAHIDRLFDSAKVVNIKMPYSKSDLMKACEDVVKAAGNGNLYLRPIVYCTKDAESIKPSEDIFNVDIYCCAVPNFHPSKDSGIKVKISSFMRSYPQYNMQAKTIANYNFLQLSKHEMTNGVEDIFLLDAQGYIVEALVSNIFVVKGDVIMTPPNNGSILPGITRRSVAEILQNQALMFSKHRKTPIVVEKNITRADVYTADEIFLSGTYIEIVPVVEVDGRKIGEGLPGVYTKIVQNMYKDLVTNNE